MTVSPGDGLSQGVTSAGIGASRPAARAGRADADDAGRADAGRRQRVSHMRLTRTHPPEGDTFGPPLAPAPVTL